MGKAHRGVYAAFHVEFLVFLLQAEVFEHLHHIVHTEVAECYPVVPGGYFCYYLCIGYRICRRCLVGSYEPGDPELYAAEIPYHHNQDVAQAVRINLPENRSS